MTSDRWARIEQIYEAAVQRSPSERAAFLESTCGGDEALRREVERLIAANDQAGEFLGSPAWEVDPDVLLPYTMAGDREMPWLDDTLAATASSARSVEAGWARSIARTTVR